MDAGSQRELVTAICQRLAAAGVRLTPSPFVSYNLQKIIVLFNAVLGGLHLLNASPQRLAATLEALRQREVPLVVPAHCTGWVASARLWESFPGRCAAPGVGGRFEFER